MRTTQIMTISLPPAMLRQFEEVRKKESRTRSELVREALRAYFEERYPAVTPTPAELAALRRGRAAFRRGDSVSLTQFLNGLERNGLEPPHHRPRAKRVSKTADKRPGARLGRLLAMQHDPFSGDIKRLKGQAAAWRRRVGNFRILYDLHVEDHRIVVAGILRRTSTTY